jgi:hypothetical protein
VIDAGESRAAKIPERHNIHFFEVGGTELFPGYGGKVSSTGAQLTSGRMTSLRRESEKFVASSHGPSARYFHPGRA